MKTVSKQTIGSLVVRGIRGFFERIAIYTGAGVLILLQAVCIGFALYGLVVIARWLGILGV